MAPPRVCAASSWRVRSWSDGALLRTASTDLQLGSGVELCCQPTHDRSPAELTDPPSAIRLSISPTPSRAVTMTLLPIHLLIVILAGRINREQQVVIDYLRAENRVLKKGHGSRLSRSLTTSADASRSRARFGRKRLGDIATIVTPDTILCRHRDLIRRKWDFSDRRRRVGRPPVDADVARLAVQITRENPSWGYASIAEPERPHRAVHTEPEGGVPRPDHLLRRGIAPARDKRTRRSPSSGADPPRHRQPAPRARARRVGERHLSRAARWAAEVLPSGGGVMGPFLSSAELLDPMA